MMRIVTSEEAAAVEVDTSAKPTVFESLEFIVVRSPTFDGAEYESVSRLLAEYGGTVLDPQELGKMPPHATMIIADNVDFPEYPSIEEGLGTIVSPRWVYDSIAKKRIQLLKMYSPNPANFFSGVMVCATGLTQGDREAIYGGVRAYGGQFSNTLTSVTTHIVATDINEDKCQMALQADIDICIVLPHWIDDCLKLARRVDERPYMLPNPPILAPQGVDIDLGANDSSLSPVQVPSDRQSSDLAPILTSKRVLLGSDLDLTPPRRHNLEQIIVNSGGSVVTTVGDANVYIGRWASGDEYLAAARKRCFVGSPQWLNWMLTHRKWTSPLRKLLHYPLVKGGLHSMHGKTIAITNYRGDARSFLEELIVAMGAQYSTKLTPQISHLIVSSPTGRKYEAARKWNIHIVNHLWLEESYALWAEQSITHPRYTHLPARVDLGCIVGQTVLRLDVLKQFYQKKSALTDAPSPASRTPRAARDKANSKLHDAMILETEFQKQLRNKRGLPPLADEVEQRSNRSPSTLKKQRSSDFDINEGNKENSQTKASEPVNSPMPPSSPVPRRATSPQSPHSALPPTTLASSPPSSPAEEQTESINVVITGIDETSIPRAKQLADVGIFDVSEPELATYIVTSRFARTEKMLKGLATARQILLPSYLEACVAAGQLLFPIPPEHIFQHDILSDAITAASVLRREGRRLLDGLVFNVTPDVRGGFAVFDRIVQAHGAGPSQLVKAGKPRRFVPCSSNNVVLITTTSHASLTEWFRDMDHGDRASHVYEAEWVMSAILHMRLEFGEEYAL